jgi:hypothetical protein
VQEHLNRERQRLHRLAVRYGLSTNLWTAVILMIPILLHEAEQISGFLLYDCSHDQLKTPGAQGLQGPDYRLPPSEDNRDQGHLNREGHACYGHSVPCP